MKKYLSGWQTHRQRYSTSVELWATMGYFLEDQEIGLGPKNMLKPLVDILSYGDRVKLYPYIATRPLEKQIP